MRYHTLSLVVALSLAPALTPSARAQAPLAGVTAAQFHQLEWLEGTWLGSGGAYPAFYEEYRRINDSTVQMRAFSDSTLRTARDSSLIEWRQGAITKSRGGRVQYLAVLLEPDRIRFLPPGTATGGFTFARRSRDEWTATLHPSAPGRPETVYTMRRLRP